FRDLVEYSKTGIFIVQDDIVVYLNPEQQRIIGAIDVFDAPIPFDHIHPDDRDRVMLAYAQAARGEIKDVDVDFRYFQPGVDAGETRMKWLTCRGCLIEYKGREALMVNMIDMTRARELEDLLDTQEKMASLGRVAAGLAHEMRNPLSGINIYLTMLKKILASGRDTDRVEGIISQMEEASSRIEAVIRRVMDFSRPGEPRFVMADINKPVDDAAGLAFTTLHKAGIEMGKHLSVEIPPCRIDTHMMEQVILNLITNAAEAMRDWHNPPHINISTSLEKSRVTVRVEDSGPGVPAELREKIFEPFFTTKSDSTGIGLSICRRIIIDHGGVLKVTDSALGGAAFVIEIPLKERGGK
ncbi:PAS domain S-box protein, partial [bacterium]|nr:PAS domain S-box protein [bacterium]